MQTCTTGSHGRNGSPCWLRLRGGGTQGMSTLLSRPVDHDLSAAACDETGLWGISFCMAGQLVCLSVWALQPWPSFEEAGLLFCIRLQIVWHLLVCVVCSNICCISGLPSNHSSKAFCSPVTVSASKSRGRCMLAVNSWTCFCWRGKDICTQERETCYQGLLLINCLVTLQFLTIRAC